MFYKIRESLWKYPDRAIKLYNSTKPIGHLLFSVFVASLIFSNFSSPLAVKGLVRTSRDKELFREGSVGSIGTLNPIFINQNQIDRDIAGLIYNKLLRVDFDGTPQPEVAASWSVSDDFLTYTFRVSDQYYWHDGEQLDADDVVFTLSKAIEMAQNRKFDTVGTALQNIKVESIDQFTFRVILTDRDATIWESLSVYIVPEHIFKDMNVNDYYLYGIDEPVIGSGRYMIESISGEQIVFKQFDKYKNGSSIKEIQYNIYRDYDSLAVAFKNNLLDGISGVPSNELTFINPYKGYTVYKKQLPLRKKVVYMNTTDPLLSNLSLRKSLPYLIDKQALIDNAKVDGLPAYSTMPSTSWAFNSDTDFYSYSPDKVKSELEGAGYILAPDTGLYSDSEGRAIELKITYLQGDANERIVDQLIKSWEGSGFKLIKHPVKYEVLVNEVLATRNFQLLLFEIETNIDPDQYNLWHSSKRSYPDLNVSGYEYSRVDTLLERARLTTDHDERLDFYTLFQKYLSEDIPVLVLYEPVYNYVVDSNLRGVQLNDIDYPQDRFNAVGKWKW